MEDTPLFVPLLSERVMVVEALEAAAPAEVLVAALEEVVWVAEVGVGRVPVLDRVPGQGLEPKLEVALAVVDAEGDPKLPKYHLPCICLPVMIIRSC